MAADLVNGEDLFGNSNSSRLGFLKEALQVLRLLKIKIKLVFVHNVPNSYKVIIFSPAKKTKFDLPI